MGTKGGNGGSGLRGAEGVQDAAPERRAIRAVAAPVEDGAVAPDGDPRRLLADVVVADERRRTLDEHPGVTLPRSVVAEPGGVLIEGNGHDFDVVAVVVVEAG